MELLKHFERQTIINGWGRFHFLSKAKPLRKFGQTSNLGTDYRTVAQFQDNSVLDETVLSANLIDSIVSDDAADVGKIVTLEGHTISAEGLLTFNVQTAVLNGTTPVALATPTARATRVYTSDGTFASPATDLVGNVYVYDSTAAGGVTGGEPDTPAATHLMIAAGEQNSFKAQTAVSSDDVWAITEISAALERTSGGSLSADVQLETRSVGGVWRLPGRRLSISTAANPDQDLKLDPPFLVGPNSDVRLRVAASGASGLCHAHISGYLGERVKNTLLNRVLG